MGKAELDMAKLATALRGAASSGVRNLSYRLEGNVVKITGEADSIAEKQNAFRAVTSVMGDTGLQNAIEVKKEVAPAAPVAPAAAVASAPQTALAASAKTHKVKKGETLSHIAKEYYGKASAYMKIFEANRDQLKDPDKIREGMVLRIPD